MNHHYEDIRDRIALDPLWWDEHAVPRYCDFVPGQLANIYADECCLLHIQCQSCAHDFRVAMSGSKTQRLIAASRDMRVSSLAETVADRGIHYGDPPNIRCCPAGASMNSVPKRVLEFWRRVPKKFDWQRVAELEVDIEPDWARGS